MVHAPRVTRFALASIPQPPPRSPGLSGRFSTEAFPLVACGVSRICELTSVVAAILLASMRTVLSLLLGMLALAGCTHGRSTKPSAAASDPFANPRAPSASTNGSRLIVTPDPGLVGKVALVNREGRFVVLNFPVGHMPLLDQRLNVYHLGLKVGEITVTGPQRDDNIVGNLSAGDATAGDVVRDR